MKSIFLLLPLVLFSSCSTPTSNEQSNSEKRNSPDYSDILIQHITSVNPNLTSFNISELEGNVFLELQMDSTTINEGEFLVECYTIDPNSLITGDINNDNISEFLMKAIWTPCEGNLYGVQWFLFTESNGEWSNISNEFGGGKYSNIENVINIKNGKLITEFIKLDEDSMRHDPSTITTFTYQLIDGKLKKIPES